MMKPGKLNEPDVLMDLGLDLAPPPLLRDRTCSDHLVEEIPFVPNLSGLLVQADEGVAFPIVDLIKEDLPPPTGRSSSSRIAKGFDLAGNSSRRRRIRVPLVLRVLVLAVVLAAVLAAFLVDSAEESIRLRSVVEFRGPAVTVDSQDTL
ncbi:hypothetical protein F511_41647 [Dorcoceras hygrometricum]|uniref:Uncharacterized protein n=1 Tax=Dorcoceras hygrometricum TaxID=472368 RepID=A0A2Z7BME7_9LAMI|nr:hypothetical protein F511_41647 [Dorcoceras hygrometricum]